MAKNLQTSDIQDPSIEGNEPEEWKASSGPPLDQIPEDILKEQNGNSPSALFVSAGQTTITILRNRTLRHNGIEYKGGTTLDLPTKDADFLIKNCYAVAGSLLPEGGIIVPKTHIPKAGNDVG